MTSVRKFTVLVVLATAVLSSHSQMSAYNGKLRWSFEVCAAHWTDPSDPSHYPIP